MENPISMDDLEETHYFIIMVGNTKIWFFTYTKLLDILDMFFLGLCVFICRLYLKESCTDTLNTVLVWDDFIYYKVESKDKPFCVKFSHLQKLSHLYHF